MNKQLQIIIYIVMVFAVCLMVVCSVNYLNLGRELKSYELQLEESREHWEKIAEEKEALQVTLKDRQNDLKEARLSLDEATERASELKAEIEQLKKEIETLKQK